MRDLVVSMNVTLDGFMAGPDYGLDWHFQVWNKEMSKAASEQLGNSDTIVMGRITYKAMAGYWSTHTIDPDAAREDIDFAEMMNGYPKIIFSRTLQEVRWNNARLATRNIAEEVNFLKNQKGKDIIIYGSGSIVSALTRLRLIDEYRIWVHPVVIGRGTPLFNDADGLMNLGLIRSRTFSSGVVLLHYRQARDGYYQHASNTYLHA